MIKLIHIKFNELLLRLLAYRLKRLMAKQLYRSAIKQVERRFAGGAPCYNIGNRLEANRIAIAECQEFRD